MTEKKTSGPGNTAIKIIQSKDRKEKDLKRWKKRKGTPVTCKTQELESHKGAEKILEEIMAKVFNKNYNLQLKENMEHISVNKPLYI